MEKMVLIDGNSLLNRAFYATPLFTTKDGFPSNAIFGFVKLLLKIIGDKKPQYLVVAFDVHAPTFRHKTYDAYKAGRKPMSQELAAQMPVLKDVLHLMRIKTVELAGYEADDLIGTLSRKFPVHSYIYTGDRDAYQLVYERADVCFTKKGVSDLLQLSKENFEAEIGLTPSQIVDLKALMGDKSDNIPGVSGIGELTAKALLQKYATLDGVYEHLDELTPSQKKKMQAGADDAKLSYYLATIDVNVPIECDLSECALKMPFPYAVKQKFAALDFKSLVSANYFEEPSEADALGSENGAQARAAKVGEINAEAAFGGVSENGVVGYCSVGGLADGLAGGSVQGSALGSVGVSVDGSAQGEGDLDNKLAENSMFERVTACEVCTCASVDEAIEVVRSRANDTFFCVYTDEKFCFMPLARVKEEDGEVGERADGCVEYVLRFKADLLGEGIYADALTPLLVELFAEGKNVAAFDVKALMHRCDEFGVAFGASYDDVGLMRYIAEGGSASEDLSYVLDAHSFAVEMPAFGLYRLFLEYERKMNEQEKKLYKTVDLPLVRVLCEMERTGVRVDEGQLDVLSERYKSEIDALSAKIYELAGESFNLNSPQQLGKILFDKLKIDESVSFAKGGAAKVGAKTAAKTKVKKNYSTSAEVLEKYADECEIVRYVLRFRQLQKLKSTYIDGIRPLIRNGRVHTTYNQNVTSTGRLSSANPNLQNIPVRTDEGRELRKLFLPSEGNVFIDADYSQIELRLMAHLSDCAALKKAYASGGDIHALTASQVFDVAVEDVTPQMRRAAKAVNFGIIYGMSAFGLAKDLGIGAKEAKAYIDKYFETYAEVKTYIDGNVQKAIADGYVTTLYGRRREIAELKSSNRAVRAFGERAAMNMPLQGTSADIIKIATLRVWERLKAENLRAALVLQVHDELVIDCPENEVETVKEILKTEMENAARLSVPLDVDIGIGRSWFETH